MPIIATFCGIVIRMYNTGEHNPPHFHAYYQGTSGTFNFEGDMLEGNLPKRQQKIVSGWAALRSEDLKMNWELAMNHEPLVKIDPVR